MTPGEKRQKLRADIAAAKSARGYVEAAADVMVKLTAFIDVVDILRTIDRRLNELRAELGKLVEEDA